MAHLPSKTYNQSPLRFIRRFQRHLRCVFVVVIKQRLGFCKIGGQRLGIPRLDQLIADKNYGENFHLTQDPRHPRRSANLLDLIHTLVQQRRQKLVFSMLLLVVWRNWVTFVFNVPVSILHLHDHWRFMFCVRLKATMAFTGNNLILGKLEFNWPVPEWKWYSIAPFNKKIRRKFGNNRKWRR